MVRGFRLKVDLVDVHFRRFRSAVKSAAVVYVSNCKLRGKRRPASKKQNYYPI
jgi:hypothetical protein